MCEEKDQGRGQSRVQVQVLVWFVCMFVALTNFPVVFIIERPTLGVNQTSVQPSAGLLKSTCSVSVSRVVSADFVAPQGCFFPTQWRQGCGNDPGVVLALA